MSTRMTADDLFTGLFGALARRGFTSFSIRTDRLDSALVLVFDRLRERSEDWHLNLRFTISRNAHGESATVREALASASLRGLVSIDNPEFQHIRLAPSKIEQLVDEDRLPGDRSLYDELAELFITNYEAAPAV